MLDPWTMSSNSLMFLSASSVLSALNNSTSSDIKFSLSQENPSLVVKSMSFFLILSPINRSCDPSTLKRYMCCGAIFSRYSTFDNTPSHTKSLKISNSSSATSGFCSLIYFHSSAVMDCVARKLINSWFNSSNCSFVNLVYFIIFNKKNAP